MSRPLVTDEDLRGFSLDNYAPLRSFSYTQWLGLVLHRSMMWNLTETLLKLNRSSPEKHSFLVEQIRHITGTTALSDVDGFEWLNVQMRTMAASLSSHPLEFEPYQFSPTSYIDSGKILSTATIRLRPQPYGGPAPSMPDPFNAALFGALDGVPLAQAYEDTPSPRRVLLEVDIDFDNARLVADFKKWLVAWRSITSADKAGVGQPTVPAWVNTTIERWRAACLVPYIDLKLIARFLKRNFGAGNLMARILPKGSEYEWAAAEKKLKRLTSEFFSEVTIDWLYPLSFDEDRRHSPENAP